MDSTEQKLAFVFPGQGAQSTGMLCELHAANPVIEDTFQQASSVLGYDLWELVSKNPEGKLDLTVYTQPALLTASIAVLRTWLEKGGRHPAVVAGHSLGEYSALVCAEVLEFADAVRLVAERGRIMQEAIPEGNGAMAAVLGLDDEQVIAICEQAAADSVVSAANFNSRGQVVIAGTREAVERALELAGEAGARKAVMLAVSVPSHCALMRQAAEKFAATLEAIEFREATIPVIQNVDAGARTDSSEIRSALVEQLHQSVHWWKSVEKLKDMGISRIVECGPGKVLAGLIRRVDRELDVVPVFDQSGLEKALNWEKS